VFVNRVWQWHFGTGIVPTASDFGTRGESPSHPELLDWLAGEFIGARWSLKALHRLILNSDAYAMQSTTDAGNQSRDASNRWLWRSNRFALDAESLRDAMLAVSGNLDRSPPEPHPFPAVSTWAFTIHNPFHAVYDSNRRSLYLMIQRNRRHPFLALFDAADPNLSVAGHFPTVTPNQTLFLMNSPFVAAQSRALAQRLIALESSPERRIQHAVELAHGARADSSQIDDLKNFLHAHASLPPIQAAEPFSADSGELRAWTALSRALLTSNAFLYVD
jgi:hypothetical protein